MNLNKLILGCAQSDTNYGLTKKKNFNQVLLSAEKYGIKNFDTSNNYKKSEFYINKFLSKNVHLTTKISCNYSLNKNFAKLVENEIKKLFINYNVKKFYGILLHDPLLPLHKKKFEIVKKILDQYKKKGLIKKIGISVYTRFELENIIKVFKPEIIQFPLNIFNQSFSDKKYLSYLKKQNIELHARSIFLQGSLLKKKKMNNFLSLWKNEFDNWTTFLKKNNLSNLEGSLKFALSHKMIDKFVIGFDNSKQLKQFLGIYRKYKTNGLSIFDFEVLKSDDAILTDPRYWNMVNQFSKKDYSKWLEVKKIVLNGSPLLSKRPSQFLPGGWPNFYKKAKGCHIYMNDNKRYLDFSLMGVGTNLLGYSNSKVNNKVIKIIKEGSSSTLNSDLDYILTKKLIDIHPWAEMATYARTGAEANSIAVRIGRIFSGKNEVAICGYHGWHDWYLSSNISNKNNLDKIHLSGLPTIGIPKELGGLTHPFRYNDIKSFEILLKKNPKIGTVFMEVERNEKPKKKFLQKIRKITNKKKIVLIFDECSSGFRETNGGLHKKYKVSPDIAVFGKALGNGIPINAIIGKKKIMLSGKNSFISSTFWTDRTGPAAGISTLDEMERLQSWKKITTIGKQIKKNWKKIALKYGVKIKISGLDAMPSFKFTHDLDLYLRSYMIQEMLKKNILVTNAVYCAIGHEKYLSKYFKELDKIFFNIKKIIKGESVFKFLNFPVCSPGFSRLN